MNYTIRKSDSESFVENSIIKKKMNFRLATIDDLNILKDIYNYARQIMRDNGNYSQWINGYPATELLKDEIKDKHLYICENKDKKILAAFSFIFID